MLLLNPKSESDPFLTFKTVKCGAQNDNLRQLLNTIITPIDKEILKSKFRNLNLRILIQKEKNPKKHVSQLQVAKKW